jgi:hypothetical protein
LKDRERGEPRDDNLTGKVEPVGIDDASAFLCRFTNGPLATFESTRYARGHKALYTLEINGEHASASWDLHDLHRIEYFDHRDEGIVRGWHSVHVTDGDHPCMKHWWVPGLQIGYEHTFIHQFADFVTAAADGKSVAPTFRDALATDPRPCPTIGCSTSAVAYFGHGHGHGHVYGGRTDLGTSPSTTSPDFSFHSARYRF